MRQGCMWSWQHCDEAETQKACGQEAHVPAKGRGAGR